MKTIIKGQTIMINLQNADVDLLTSSFILKKYIKRVIKILGMTMIADSMQACSVPVQNSPADRTLLGITVGALLLESHAYIHTWPEKQYARVEISACKKITPQQIKNLCHFTGIFFDCELNKKISYW